MSTHCMIHTTMKTPTHHLFFCYFILSSALINTLPSLVSVAAEKPSPVVDIAKNYVLAGSSYYILPAIPGRGGGLTLAPVGNRTCPLNVVQEPQEVDAGLPLIFSLLDINKGVVCVSTDQNIVFNAAPASYDRKYVQCSQKRVKVVERDEGSGGYLIVEGNPGAGTTSNWFKVEEYEGDYKLVFCPTVCNFCKVVCRDVGVFVEGAVRLLGFNLTDGPPPEPFRFVFRKA